MTPLDHAIIKAYAHEADAGATAISPQLGPVPVSETLPVDSPDRSASKPGAADATVAPAGAAPDPLHEVASAVPETPIADSDERRGSNTGGDETEDPPALETVASESTASATLPDDPQTGVAGSAGGGARFCPKIPTLDDLGLPAQRLRRDGPQAGSGRNSVPEPHAPFLPGNERGPVARGPTQAPAWHVRRFDFPDICRRLTRSADREIQRLCDGLARAAADGHKTIGLVGTCRGAGCTTLTLCAARSIAGQGLRTVLVEGDFCDPQLAVRLGLAPEIGFEDVLNGDLPLAEGLVESDDDHFIVLPLVGRLSAASLKEQADSRLIAAFAELRRRYDLVILDLGALEPLETASPLLGPKLTADVVLVRDRRRADRHHCDQARRHLETVGAVQLGIVENFVAG